KDKAEQLWVNLEQSKIPTALLIREELKGKLTSSRFLITKSIRPVYSLAEKVAAADKVSVLILGETGTGKEGLARFIHDNSSRAKAPFIALNCASMGESLLESRLFGYSKGSHNMAFKDTPGLFEAADSGTIFLDEIGDITPYMQQSLLRVLQEKEICRIGEAKVRKVNVRVIAATNKNLYKRCSEGKFRWDLFYRLSVVELMLPSLMERGISETEELFDFILNLKSNDFKTVPPKIPADIRKIIFNYPFPGNIRELENLIERIYATMEDSITEDILPKNLRYGEKEHSLKLQDVIALHVNSVYQMCEKNLVRTAKILDIAPNTVKSKINIK
ncbi:MAG: sigma 54-interacting transcriptional regulator, partial [Melioribacteraceae bacterium]